MGTASHMLNSTTRKLPIEVLEQIIGFVPQVSSGDSESWIEPEGSELDLLRALALTCHDFLPKSRFHLFARVTIPSAKTSQLLVGAAISSPIISTIPNRISIRDRQRSIFGKSKAHPPSWVYSTFYQLPTYFPNFTHLSITDLEFNAFNHPRAAILFSRFQMVNELDLCEVSFSSFDQFRRLVASFTNLKKLCVSYPEWPTTLAPPIFQTYRRIRVPTLTDLSYTVGFKEGPSVFLQSFVHLFATPIVSPLQKLTIDWDFDSDPIDELEKIQEALSTLFLYCRNSLHTITVAFHGNDHILLPLYDLNHLPRLHTLEFQRLLTINIPELINTLSTITFNNILTIRLRFRLYGPKDFDIGDMKLLDEFLSGGSTGPRFGCILLRASWSLVPDPGFEQLRGWLPLCDAAGILGDWR